MCRFIHIYPWPHALFIFLSLNEDTIFLVQMWQYVTIPDMPLSMNYIMLGDPAGTPTPPNAQRSRNIWTRICHIAGRVCHLALACPEVDMVIFCVLGSKTIVSDVLNSVIRTLRGFQHTDRCRYKALAYTYIHTRPGSYCTIYTRS